jgi:hypothetical protein
MEENKMDIMDVSHGKYLYYRFSNLGMHFNMMTMPILACHHRRIFLFPFS